MGCTMHDARCTISASAMETGWHLMLMFVSRNSIILRWESVADIVSCVYTQIIPTHMYAHLRMSSLPKVWIGFWPQCDYSRILEHDGFVFNNGPLYWWPRVASWTGYQNLHRACARNGEGKLLLFAGFWGGKAARNFHQPQLDILCAWK